MSWAIVGWNFYNCKQCDKKGICEDDCSSSLKIRKWRKRYRIWNVPVKVLFT